jgi:hypothetical protein
MTGSSRDCLAGQRTGARAAAFLRRRLARAREILVCLKRFDGPAELSKIMRAVPIAGSRGTLDA